ncbi:MAG: FHA domain-containing protein [Deltaproteobacteria bacterium]|nr:FHA domain-containing protein [Deltaproteobacteria bacterium]
MELSNASLLVSQRDFPFSGLDEFFRLITPRLKDGYAVARRGGTLRFIFIIEGNPYCGAVVGPEKKGCTEIRDFFTWYRERGSADIDIFSSDKKTLLCMLVKINYAPSQSFSTDVVNLEDVLKRVKKRGGDGVMAIGEAGRWGFAIFMKGEVVFTSLPGKEDSAESPLERLLLYTYSVPPESPLSVEIYTETKVMPAGDSLPFPAEGIATHYTGAPYEAYLELIEGGITKGAYPVKGTLTIGRETTNQVYLEEAGVSREHAAVKQSKGGYVIEDLKSANGTFFKGIRITAKELNDNDEINIRKYTLRFHGPRREGKGEEARPSSEPEGVRVAPERPSRGIEPAPAPIKGPALVMDDGTAYPLGGVTTIGKDEDCSVNLSGMLVAKKHAVIMKGKDFFKVIKKSGLSPLKINGEKADEHILKDGDVIEIGGRTMTFRAG